MRTSQKIFSLISKKWYLDEADAYGIWCCAEGVARLRRCSIDKVLDEDGRSFIIELYVSQYR